MSRKLTILQSEGQRVLQITSAFGINDKFAEELGLSVIDRTLAVQDVVRLYRVLKKKSPMLKDDSTPDCFGNPDNWRKSVEKDENGKENTLYKLKNVDAEETLILNREAMSGLRWVLLAMVHLKSGLSLNVGSQDAVSWPVIEKAGLLKNIEKKLKLSDAKREEIEFDDEDDGDENDKETENTDIDDIDDIEDEDIEETEKTESSSAVEPVKV